MKTLTKLLTASFIVLCIISMKAQEKTSSSNILENTQWQGVADIPSPETVTFQFTKDLFTIIWNGKLLEQMTYTVENNKITMVKTSGSSPCPMLSQGTYKFTVLNDQLNFEGVSEGCIERKGALGINTYSRVLPLE